VYLCARLILVSTRHMLCCPAPCQGEEKEKFFAASSICTPYSNPLCPVMSQIIMAPAMCIARKAFTFWFSRQSDFYTGPRALQAVAVWLQYGLASCLDTASGSPLGTSHDYENHVRTRAGSFSSANCSSCFRRFSPWKWQDHPG
jgi:hypothetical protein